MAEIAMNLAMFLQILQPW